MPRSPNEEKRAVFRRALAAGQTVDQARKLADIARSTAYKWRDEDPELAALMTRNKPRARAEGSRSVRARTIRTALEPVRIVPELVDDANTIGGPDLAEIMEEGWRVFMDPTADVKLRGICYREVMRVKAAPMVAELQRAANAAPVQEGPERVRIALPAKAPLPDA